MGATIGPKMYDGEKYQVGRIYTQKRQAEDEIQRLRKDGYKTRLFHSLLTYTWVVYYRR